MLLQQRLRAPVHTIAGPSGDAEAVFKLLVLCLVYEQYQLLPLLLLLLLLSSGDVCVHHWAAGVVHSGLPQQHGLPRPGQGGEGCLDQTL
jgi:hypothetical protein